jgi:hypothetical protein
VTGKISNTARVTYAHPTAKHPFYHLLVQVTLKDTSQFTVKDVSVNGSNIRDFFVYNSGRFQKSYTLSTGGDNVLVVRYDWLASESVKVAVAGSRKDGKGDGVIAASSRAPEHGGYWNEDWPYYSSIVCTETAGIRRINEPVHTTLAFYSDRVSDPAQELRIVRVDARTGEAQEIPSQVHSVEVYRHDEPGERYQPTTICEVVFSATVDAYGSQVFLAFYGNQRASSPSYSTGLKKGGSGLGITLENEYYNIKLSKTSGAIDEMTMKTGSGFTFEHHLETNGALHWNPGIYAPPRPWLHASDWDPPEHYAEMHGPVFSMTKRSGTLDHYPEATISVGYRFYDQVPWMLMTSTIEITKDISVKALRNGEVVLNRELVDEFAWCEPDGSRGLVRIQDTPRHPRHAKELPYNTPWACFISRGHDCGLGMVTVELAHFRNDGGICRTFRPYSYLQWGPWAYYARPLVYTFLSAGPGRLIPVTAGNIYYEKMAFLPLELEDEKAGFRYLDQLHMQLKNPLLTHIVEDADERAPKSWMAPVLVQEFEEM